MAYVSVRNSTRNADLGRKIRVASSLIDRLVGLLSTSELGEGEGVYLTPCQSIHTFFMRYPIDAVFIGPGSKIIGAITLRPWRVSRWYRGCRGVIELQAGSLQKTRTQIGDDLTFEELS